MSAARPAPPDGSLPAITSTTGGVAVPVTSMVLKRLRRDDNVGKIRGLARGSAILTDEPHESIHVRDLRLRLRRRGRPSGIRPGARHALGGRPSRMALPRLRR